MNQTPALSIVTCLVSCIGISALSVSPTFAQVNGPGPSPGSDFDTVINLPEDQANVTIGDFSVIAGGLGETIQVNIADGGTIGDDAQVRSGGEVNVIGGIVGGRFVADSGSEVNISSGSVGSSFQALNGSLVTISGGTVNDSLEVNAGSEVNISDGLVSDIVARGAMNISGGTIDSLFQASSGSEITISGGSIDAIAAGAGSQVNLIGSEFLVDGQPIDSLVPGEAFTITARSGALTGVLADGQSFSFRLNTGFSLDGNFSSNAMLTVTLSPTVILGDVNRDGTVTFSDISPFISVLSSGSFQAEADIDQDDAVTFADISPFIAILASN